MLVPLMVVLAAGVGGTGGSALLPRVTVLYDNTTAVAGSRADWGFSCLVQTSNGDVLFDGGASEDVLRHNLSALGASLQGVRAVVISHAHGDHTGGVPWAVAARPGLTVYAPSDLPASLQRALEEAGARTEVVSAPVEVVKGVWATGAVGDGMPEQALVVQTPRGPAVITGCAHPGIVAMVRSAASLSDHAPYMVLGGFHLVSSTPKQVNAVTADLKALGVERAAPGHCTGEKAIALFRAAFGDSFTPLGVGRTITLGE